MTADDYRHQLQALLPTGAAWARQAGALWSALLDAFAQELARIGGRALRLVDEADPRTTAELLVDWERVAGLPDSCSGLLADTQQGRREDLLSKLVGLGGQSRAYFIDVAASLGFEITIEEFHPFRVGQSRAGDALTNGDWRFTWRVRAPKVTVKKFRVGQSAVGERLATWGNAGLECRLRQLAPAHTILLFAYGDTRKGVLLLPGGAPLLMPDGRRLLLR